MKNQKGITLIALVITIIVLLILAGVSISMVIGNNGILNQARTAKIETIGGSEKEQVELAFIAAKTKQLRGEFTGEIDDEKLKTELIANGVMENISAVEYDSTKKQLKVKFKSGNVFYLENDIVTWNREESGVPSTPNTPEIPSTPNTPEIPSTGKVYLDPAQWEYTIDNTTGEATITKYKVSGATTVIIPNYIVVGDEEIPITQIGTGRVNVGIWSDYSEEHGSYSYLQKTVEVIEISEGIETIGDFAFSGAKALYRVDMPKTLKTIGDYAFTDCIATTIVIPENVTTIGNGAFASCTELLTVELYNRLQSIGWLVFDSCPKFSTIIFNGSSDDWAKININNENSAITNAEIVYK